MPTLPIAVDADSMATWVLPALAPLAAGVCFDLHRVDQEHTRALLRRHRDGGGDRGRRPGAGLHLHAAGGMRYRPMAGPGFVRRWFPPGPTPEALARAPVVVHDRTDDLQHWRLRSAPLDGVREAVLAAAGRALDRPGEVTPPGLP